MDPILHGAKKKTTKLTNQEITFIIFMNVFEERVYFFFFLYQNSLTIVSVPRLYVKVEEFL